MIHRRRFLETTAAAASAALLGAQPTAPLNSIAIPDSGWRLWLDQTAEWKNDAIHLPEDVDLAKLAVNAPTGGWDALSGLAGIAVELPATVEQFYCCLLYTSRCV